MGVLGYVAWRGVEGSGGVCRGAEIGKGGRALALTLLLPEQFRLDPFHVFASHVSCYCKNTVLWTSSFRFPLGLSD